MGRTKSERKGKSVERHEEQYIHISWKFVGGLFVWALCLLGVAMLWTVVLSGSYWATHDDYNVLIPGTSVWIGFSYILTFLALIMLSGFVVFFFWVGWYDAWDQLKF